MKNTVKVVMNLLPMSRTRSTPIRMYGLRLLLYITIFFTRNIDLMDFKIWVLENPFL